jgi:hypothetical protein
MKIRPKHILHPPCIVADNIQKFDTFLSGNTKLITAFCAGINRHIARNDLFNRPNDIIPSMSTVGAYTVIHVVKNR